MSKTNDRKADPVFVIAEAGVNHNGDLGIARRLVEAAADCGADAVKFQTFRAESVVTPTAAKADYQSRRTGEGESQLEMLKRLELSRQDHHALKAHCGERGIEFLATPFDETAADFLAGEIGVARIKVPSGEITNAPFLLHLARLGLPLILSTGMSTFDEVEAALGVLAHGFSGGEGSPNTERPMVADDLRISRDKVTLLHCTSDYPAAFEEVNLKVVPEMTARFSLPIGLSDHTPGHAAALGAVALGAVVIEKHLTLDKAMAGPDHAASLEPDEFAELVANIRALEAALGTSDKRPQPSEVSTMAVARRSLVALRPIKRGEAFDETNVGAKRPGTGLSPMRYWQVLGRRAPRDFDADELIVLENDRG